MRYLSIDIETTGLDAEVHQIIEFGAIIEDTNDPKSYENSPKFRRIVLSETRNYNFSSFAAKINADLIALISQIEGGVKIVLENNENLSQAWLKTPELIPSFKSWLVNNGFEENGSGVIEIIAAGKNFASFDKRFIEKLKPEMFGLKFHHRSLDPTALFIHPTDIFPPSTDLCKERANLKGKVKHEALSDAWDVIQLLRWKYVPIEVTI